MERTHTAYLNVAIRNRVDEGPFPPIVNAHIHSAPPGSLTAGPGELWANICYVDAPTYAEAERRIIELVMTQPQFTWLRIWIEPGYEAHQRRFELYRERLRRLDGANQ